jgi:hypothetical protein
MNGCCDDNLPIQYRYTEDGTLQRSMNGGVDWIDCPEYDPRVYSPTFPPLAGADGTDKKCAAATGAALLIKQQVGDQLTDDMSRYTLSQLITDWVKTMIQSSNPFEALLTVITNKIFALVIATLRPALTDPVYAQLKCIFYCRMATDASFDTASWALVRSDITDQIGGIAGLFLEHLVYLLGEKGITNLVRAGAASTGDCSDCDCGLCPTAYWPAGAGTITQIGDCTWRLASEPESGHQAVYVWFDNSTGTYDPTKCAQVISWAIHSGSGVDQNWNECTTGTFHGHSDPAGHCCSQLYFTSGAAFEVDVFIEDCP